MQELSQRVYRRRPTEKGQPPQLHSGVARVLEPVPNKYRAACRNQT